jgi:hypothetical protein
MPAKAKSEAPVAAGMEIKRKLFEHFSLVRCSGDVQALLLKYLFAQLINIFDMVAFKF